MNNDTVPESVFAHYGFLDMTTSTSSSSDHPPTIINEAGHRTFWQWLVEPAASIHKLEARRQARLLAVLLVILIPLIMIGVAMSWYFIRIPAISSLLVLITTGLTLAYILSRTRHYLWGAALTVAFSLIAPFVPILFNPNLDPDRMFRALIWLALAISLGNLLLSTRSLVIAIAALGLALALLPVFHPLQEWSRYSFASGFIAAMSILTLVAAHHRNLVERDRLAELSAANRKLDALRASLEQQVQEQTGALATTNALLQTLMDTTPDLIYLKDVQSRFTLISSSQAQRFGLSDPAQAIGKTDFDFFTEEHARQAYTDEQTVLRSGQSLVGFEERETWPDGSETWVSTTKVPLRDAAGKIMGTFGISRDITERKQAEEALRRQNSYLAALHDTTLGLLSRTELNSLLADILLRAGQLVGTPHGYIYLLDGETSESEMEVKVGTGSFVHYVGQRIKSGDGISGLAWQTRCPQVVDDYDQWVGRIPTLERGDFGSIMAVPLISAAQGVIGVMGLAYGANSHQIFGEVEVDLLTRFSQLTSVALDNARMYSSMQEYAAESAALYRAAANLLNPGADLAEFADQIAQVVTREFALSNCGILLMDETGTHLKRIANAGEFRASNVPILPLSGSGLTVSAAHSGEMIYVPDVTADPRYLAGDSRTRSELVMPLKSQQRVIGILDLQSSELNAFDERSRRIIVAFAKHAELALENVRLVANLAEAYRRLQEDQKQLLAAEKMASLGRLTAGIAHEMNTPLAAMRAGLSEINNLIAEYQNAIGDADITLDDHHGIASDMQRAVQVTISSAERAAAFVRSIKSQTRDPSPSERLRFEVVSVVNDALLLLGHALRYGKCTVSFEYDAPKLELIGSPGRLAQVITNLVTNAIDASAARGGGPIQVQLNHTPFSLDLRVSDSGTGILPEHMSQIFEPMFTTKPFGQGTGLGLTIIHDIVTGEFGGTIEVVSQPGQGAAFTVHFPIHKEI